MFGFMYVFDYFFSSLFKHDTELCLINKQVFLPGYLPSGCPGGDSPTRLELQMTPQLPGCRGNFSADGGYGQS